MIWMSVAILVKPLEVAHRPLRAPGVDARLPPRDILLGEEHLAARLDNRILPVDGEDALSPPNDDVPDPGRHPKPGLVQAARLRTVAVRNLLQVDRLDARAL